MSDAGRFEKIMVRDMGERAGAGEVRALQSAATTPPDATAGSSVAEPAAKRGPPEQAVVVTPVSLPPPGGPRAKRKGGKRRLVFGLIALIVLTAGGLYGWHWYTVGRFQETTDDAYLQADKVTVSPKIGGYIAEVLVGDNQKVKAGQVVARIDDRDYRIALAQMTADSAKAKATLDGVEAAIAQQQAQVAQSRAEVQNAQAALTFAQQEFTRYQALVRTGSGTLQRVQQAQSDLLQRQATLDKNRAALIAAQKQIATYEALAASERAALDRARVNIQQAELNIDYATVISPIDGVVGDRSLRIGQLVQPGTNVLTVVPMGKDIYLVANFKETQLTHMSAGQPVEFSVDAYPDHVFHGRLQSMAPGTGAQFALLPPENATGNFTKVVQRVPIRITLADDPFLKRLRPGLSVEATVETRGAFAGEGADGRTKVGMGVGTGMSSGDAD